MKKLIAIAALAALTSTAQAAENRRVGCVMRKTMDDFAKFPMSGEQVEKAMKKRQPEIYADLKKSAETMVAAIEKYQKQTGNTDRQISMMLLVTGSKAGSTTEKDGLWRLSHCW